MSLAILGLILTLFNIHPLFVSQSTFVVVACMIIVSAMFAFTPLAIQTYNKAQSSSVLQPERRKLLGKGRTLASSIIVSSLVSLVPKNVMKASAVPTSASIPKIKKIAEIIAEPWIEAVINSSGYQKFVQNLENNYPRTLHIRKDLAYALGFETAIDERVAAYIPVEGDEKGSFYGVIFNGKTKQVDYTMNALIIPGQNSEVQFSMEVNGKITSNVTYNAAGKVVRGGSWDLSGKYISMEGSKFSTAKAQANVSSAVAHDWWRCFSCCFQSQTGDNALLSILSASCAILGSVFFGACAVGLAGVLGDQVTYCLTLCGDGRVFCGATD